MTASIVRSANKDVEAGKSGQRGKMSKKKETEASDSLTEFSHNKSYEPEGCGGSAFCDPRRRHHRFLILIFICFLSFGTYFCMDNPAAMQGIILDDLKINKATFMRLYAWYSYPNVILALCGGFLIDRVFGIRLGAFIFACFITVGQVIFALGAYLNKYWLMELGRFVFGVGGESLAVAQNTYAASWFKGRELNMVFGLQISMARIGSTVNMNIMQPVYKQFKNISKEPDGYKILGYSLFFAAIFCLFSLMVSMVLAYFDRRANKILHKDEAKTGEVISFKDIKDFPGSCWLIFFICVTYYVAVFCFIDLGLVFFEAKFDLTAKEASVCNSLVYLISAGASPVFGFVVDRTGLSLMWLLLAIFATLGSHALLGLTFLTPYVAMGIMGVGYSLLACALWPLVARIVPSHQLGTAYGLMQSIQNLGLAVFAQVSGSIVDNSGYLILEVFFCGCLCASLLAAVVLYIWDAAKGAGLNDTAKLRDMKRIKEEMKGVIEEEKGPLLPDDSEHYGTVNS
eukprot:Seg786.5 transcript_id=Seg786.5/GoldUCD/mRNA.D3Y31 product="Major facilitator superfamily domain-containing protein 1" protein_id=Seg786.5/GoldUCD/D3Y31